MRLGSNGITQTLSRWPRSARSAMLRRRSLHRRTRRLRIDLATAVTTSGMIRCLKQAGHDSYLELRDEGGSRLESHAAEILRGDIVHMLLG